MTKRIQEMPFANGVSKRKGYPPVFFGWWVVLASILGLSIGPGQFAFGSLGLVMIPLQREFGWDRAQVSLALTLFTVVLAVSIPVIGGLVDRYGSRRVVLPSVFVFGALLASVGLLVSQLWHLWLVFGLIGSLAAGANSLPYMRTISAWFDRRRGLAIGISMTGAGLGYFYVPLIVNFMTTQYGWRAAYLALAVTVMMVIPVLYYLFRETPEQMGLHVDGDEPAASSAPQVQLTGMNRDQVIRQSTFWLLVLIFAILSFSLFGVLPHLVPMLTDRGMEPSLAASIASFVGLSSLFARAVNGYLIDRFFAPRVAFVCFLLSAVGIGMLATGVSSYFAVLIATFLVGFSIGAEMDLLAFLAGRYFGLKNFGQIYGILFISLLAGTSLGPVTFGYAYVHFGSYFGVLSACCALNACASLMTFRLPRFPNFSEQAET